MCPRQRSDASHHRFIASLANTWGVQKRAGILFKKGDSSNLNLYALAVFTKLNDNVRLCSSASIILHFQISWAKMPSF